jgi:protease IV
MRRNKRSSNRPAVHLSHGRGRGPLRVGLHALGALGLAGALGTSGAFAQTAMPMSTSSVGFPASLVAPEGAHALAVNPASLGSLDGTALTFSHVASAQGSLYETRSDAGWLAGKLGKHLALGTGAEFVRSGDARLYDTNAFVLGGAINAGPKWSLGSTYRMRSPERGLPNVHTADIGLTFRPSSLLGLSLIGRDLAGNDVRVGTANLRRAGLLAFHLRPLGDDRFTLELAGLVDRANHTGARVAAQAFIPYVGRLAAAAEVGRAGGRDVWMLSAGLDLRWGGLSIAPGIHSGTRSGAEPGWSLLASMQAVPRPGVPAARYVAKIKLGEFGSRGSLGALLALDRALHDPRIKGVVIDPTGAELGLASAQEVRLMVSALAEAGKPSYCHLEWASGSTFYACAGAKRVSIDPAGIVRLLGVAHHTLFFGDLLRELGVRADFVRIGRYKSAPEQFTNSGSSEGAREQESALLDDAYARLTADLAKDLGRDEAAVRALIDEGPFLAAEAKSRGLVASEVDTHDLDEDARVVFGERAQIVPQAQRAGHDRFGPAPQVAVVVIDGNIVDGENVDVPLLDMHMTGGKTISDTLDRLAADPRVRAIVLRVDSPGGAVMASDQIWRAVMRVRKKKPVVASMGSVAASGGYYVAAAADEIWASPSTLTGSIGIFYGKVDLAPLAARFGIGIETQSRGKRAGSESLYRPFTEEERAMLADKLRAGYRQFLARVAEGRHMPIERVDALGRGRVYSGDAAEREGLVDKLGGFGAALARARELAHLPVDAEITIVPRRPSGLLDYVGSALGVQAAAAPTLPVPEALKPALAQALFLSRVGGAAPLALYEGTTPVE